MRSIFKRSFRRHGPAFSSSSPLVNLFTEMLPDLLPCGCATAAAATNSVLLHRRVGTLALLFVAASFSCFVLYRAGETVGFKIPDSLSSHATRVFFFIPADQSLPLDADVMWFRDPFPHFYKAADFQIACDHFVGDPEDMENRPNGGFLFVRSNNRSIEFYKFWYTSREMYPDLHDQDVLNNIKYDSFIIDIDLKMRFLDTAYFGGFCEPSKDLNEVCTMHANCCFGLESKLHDLRVLLQDWKSFLSLPPTLKKSLALSWRVPQNCSLHSLHWYAPPPENIKQESVE